MAAPKKKPTATNNAAHRPGKKKPGRTKSKKAGDKRRRKGPARGKARNPSKQLKAAELSLRDTRMLTQRIQGWTLAEIAAEHNVTRKTVERRIEARRANLPRILDKEAAEIIEDFVVELQLSIADFERIASAAIEGANLNTAVGAKGRADKAREQLLELLQSVGHLPHDLGTLTWIIDIRAVVVEINVAVEGFAKAVAAIPDIPERPRVEVLDAAGKVVKRLDEIADSPQTVTPTTPTDDGGDPDAT